MELTLITSLGVGPNGRDLILQFIDFFCKCLSYNPHGQKIKAGFHGSRLTDIYLITTTEPAVIESFNALNEDIQNEISQKSFSVPPPILHEIRLDMQDVDSSENEEMARSIIYREIQKLSLQCDLIIASAGRKIITQTLIEAGLLYGCKGYLIITAKNKEKRSESMNFNILWTPARRFVEERRKGLIKDELGDNFRSLYLLPANVTEHLRNEYIGIDSKAKEADLEWLKMLPKADLHCHLGGAYDAALLKELAGTLLDDLKIDEQRRMAVRTALEKKLGISLTSVTSGDLRRLRPEKDGAPVIHCLENLEYLFDDMGEEMHICNAVLIQTLGEDQIEEISSDGRLDGEQPKDLRWYMACGNLAGSSILQTENTLRKALLWLMEAACKENVRLLEVRFSPDNYTRAGLDIRLVIDTLLDEARKFVKEHFSFYVNFLIMATRHKDRASMVSHVAAAVTFSRIAGKGPRIAGFDLAGQEEGNDPALFQDIFMPLHHHFINITIHAGEMEQDDRIWEAIYLLHAKRIGHGLKLVNNKKMMGYVRDYGIAIEMCPSSNRQTNGFRYFDVHNSQDQDDVYPLKTYLDSGILVTINTDNRGISHTTLSNEYLEAARMTQDGLSRWEVLRLVKNGFKAAFLPKDEKDRLLKEIDEEIFKLMLDRFLP
ncbi:MAG: CRISPR-associated ring nuclease [Dissulfuribacterales bacterium]